MPAPIIPPTRPPVAPIAPAPASAATIGPAATSGTTPGRDKCHTQQSLWPCTPPEYCQHYPYRFLPAVAQLDMARLFEPDLPQGFHYRDDFISREEERALIKAIAEVEFA